MCVRRTTHRDATMKTIDSLLMIAEPTGAAWDVVSWARKGTAWAKRFIDRIESRPEGVANLRAMYGR